MPLIPGKEFFAQLKDRGDTAKFCPVSGKPMEPRVDGHHQCVGGVEVSEDTYFNMLGDALEGFPFAGQTLLQL